MTATRAAGALGDRVVTRRLELSAEVLKALMQREGIKTHAVFEVGKKSDTAKNARAVQSAL